jgi:hypothetical protein
MSQVFTALPLSRTSLLSLATICVTVALFATGATYAITSSDSATGKVTAASAAINVYGSGPSEAIDFTTGSTNCPNALAPGDTCGPATVTVTNLSPNPVSLTGPTKSLTATDAVWPTGCDNSTTNWLVFTTGLITSTLMPGESTTFTVSIKMQSGAVPGCQGETATVTVTVNSST